MKCDHHCLRFLLTNPFDPDAGIQAFCGACMLLGRPAPSSSEAAIKFRSEFKESNKSMPITQPSSFYVIISDEGPATKPKQHATYPEAEIEARRLSQGKPGLNFTVFESKSKFHTPKADTEKTVYSTPYPYPPPRTYYVKTYPWP